jgi:hypothetical protein
MLDALGLTPTFARRPATRPDVKALTVSVVFRFSPYD